MLERDVQRDVSAALEGARARPAPDATKVARFVYASSSSVSSPASRKVNHRK